MSDEEQTRDEIEEIVKEDEPVQEAVIETIIEEEVKQVTYGQVSFHNFKSRNFKLSVSNPKNKCVAYVSVLSLISNCQGLGRKNNFEILKTGRKAKSKAKAKAKPKIKITKEPIESVEPVEPEPIVVVEEKAQKIISINN